jgi:hypothetical protein
MIDDLTALLVAEELVRLRNRLRNNERHLLWLSIGFFALVILEMLS